MQLMKKVTILLLIAFMFTAGWNTLEGLAAEKDEPFFEPTIGSPSINLQHGVGNSSDNIGILSTQYLMSGSSSIELLSSTKVRVSGNTRAYTYVDSIMVSLYLERWDSTIGKWIDALAIGAVTNYNSSIVSVSKEVVLPAGYYYRTRALHRVTNRGVTEQNTSISNYIYAN